MSEWWTYSLSDFLMFSAGTYWRLLELHNQAWFPFQPLFSLPAVWLLWAVARRSAHAWRVPAVLMGFSWVWVAWAFHLERYAINWAARYVGWAFAAQGLALVTLGMTGRRLYTSRSGVAGASGVCLLAMVVLYPLLSLVLQRPWGQSEWAGLMPDPTALAAIGLLLCLRTVNGEPWRLARVLLLVVPMVWCTVSGATLWTMGS